MDVKECDVWFEVMEQTAYNRWSCVSDHDTREEATREAARLKEQTGRFCRVWKRAGLPA